MLKLIFSISIFIFFSLSKNALSSDLKKFECTWDNKKNSPCVEIITNLPNTSKYTKSALNRIVINKKQIEDTGAIDLVQLLQTVPDINITQSGPTGQQASMFMRGSGSNHTVVMINGIAINDQSTTQGLHDFGVDFIQTIQQIEIYPGSSATQFGTNAIGGAVNIILAGDYKDSFSVTTDENQNYELYLNQNIIKDNSSINLKLGSVRNESISVRGNIDDEKDEVKNYTTNINFEKYLNPETRIFNTLYLRQTVAEYDNSTTNQTGYEGDNRMATNQFGLNKTTEDYDINYTFFYNIYDREYDERGTIDNYKSEVFGLKYNFSKDLKNNISYGIGSEYKYDWGYFDNNGSYTASTKGNVDNLAFYSNVGFNFFKDINISLFARNDDHKHSGRNSTYKLDLNKTFNNFLFGYSRMTGLRNPTLYELFGTDNFGYSGNRNLKAEKSITDEIYTEFSINKNLDFSTRIFRSSIFNNIEYVSNKYVNDTDDISLNQSGVNNELKFRKKNYNLTLFSSFLSSKKENGSDQLRRPEKTYGINFTKKIKTSLYGELDLNLNYNHYGKHFDTHSTSFSTVEIDSTDLLNISIAKNINNNSKFFFTISNLFDESYQRPHGYNQEKRNIKFGLRY